MVVCCALGCVSCVLQNVIQSYFREWLHSTGNIRQVCGCVWVVLQEHTSSKQLTCWLLFVRPPRPDCRPEVVQA